MNNEQCCSVDGGRGICPLFWTHPGGFDSSRVPTPGNLPSKAKIMLMPEGQPRGGGRGWAQLELIDALEKHYSFRGPINDRIWHGIDNKLNET